MARLARDSRLETREARSRLAPRHEQYWRLIQSGLSLGYRRGPRGGIWYVRFLDENGNYHKKQLAKADDYQDANGVDVLDFGSAQRKAIEASDLAIVASSGKPRTVGAVVDDYLGWAESHTRSYYDTKVKADAHIGAALRDVRLDKLTTKRLRDWRDGLARVESDDHKKPIDPDVRRKKRATANRVWTILRAALNRAFTDGAISSDRAWRQVRPFRDVDAPRIRHLTKAEAKRLMNACPPDFRSLVQAALLTGCRYGELTAMLVAAYDSESETVNIRHSKSGEARHVYLTAEGKRFFDRQTAGRASTERMFTRADGGAWRQSHQKRRMVAACKVANIDPPVSFHVLRHTYGSLLAMEGVPMAVIAEALGHSDTRMTEKHYAHLRDSYVSDAIRDNLPNFGIKADNVRRIRA
jgi:integrase